MSGQHAFLAPSFAPVWAHCSAAPGAAAGIVVPDTPETVEGTAAHWVVASQLELFRQHQYMLTDDYSRLGYQDPDGTLITRDMTDAAEVMVEDVRTRVPHEKAAMLLIEQPVTMPHIHEHNWGTLDAALVDLQAGQIVLWDYKHGHRDVEAEGNFQMADYLAGLVAMFQIDGHAEQHIDVEVRVVHPRAYSSLSGAVSVHRGKLADWRADWNLLHSQANEAFTAPRYRPGLHCRDCPAVGKCPSARKAGYSIISYVDAATALDTMDGGDLAYEYEILSQGLAIVKARLEAVEEDLQARVRGGDTSTGLALQASRGRETWTAPAEQVITLGHLFGADFGKVAAKTPNQARALVPKEQRESFDAAISGLVTRTHRTVKLVPADGTTAARAFSKK